MDAKHWMVRGGTHGRVSVTDIYLFYPPLHHGARIAFMKDNRIVGLHLYRRSVIGLMKQP